MTIGQSGPGGGAAIAVRAAEPGPAERVGYAFLLVFLFFFVTRVLDFSFWYLRIPLILSGILLLCTVFSGNVLEWVRSKAAVFLAAFTAWVVLCVPFSVWRGGSFEVATATVRGFLLLVFLVALLTTTARCIAALRVIGYATAVAAVVAVAAGQKMEGRLIMPGGTYGDPNTFCLALVMGLPFLWMDASLADRAWRKVPAFLATAVVLWACLATGSRSGLVALLVVLAIHFLRAPVSQKLRLVLTGATVVLIMPFFLSDYLLDRLRRFSGPVSGEMATEEQLDRATADYYSLKSREFLLMRSLELTFEHPITGVGPGQFQVAEAEKAGREGQRGAWHDTHNTYTQVSSETGIPGLLLFVACLVFGLTTTLGITKDKPLENDAHWQRIWKGAAYLQLSVVAMLAGALFLNIAYAFNLPLMIGLSVAYEAAVRKEMDARLPVEDLRPAPVARPQVIGPAPQYK
jgi:O-antigen ligase